MKKALILSIIAAILLTACGAEPPRETAEEKALSSEGDQMLDSNIYSQAIAANNLEQCGLIADAKKIQECTDIVEANLLTIEANQKMDVKLCAKIKLERYKENCEFMVKEQERKSEEQTKTKAQIDQDVQLANDLSVNEDPSKCKQITTEDIRIQCEINSILNKANSTGEAKYCDELPDDNLVARCKENILKSKES